MTSEKGVSRLVAAVAPEAGAALSERGLVQELRRTLPRYMVPNVVRILDGLPMTANWKLDGAAVAALMAPRSTVRSTLAPRGRAEELLVELFREVLQDDSASAASDFFELGGDSMRAIRLISLAREKGMRFTVRDVYANPTVSELAARAILGDSESADARPPFSLLNREATSTWPNDVEDAYPMTALQSGMIFHQELAPGSGMYHIVLSYRVADAMHPEEFRSAVQAVMDAHVVLRTSFDLGHPAGPMQRVHRPVDPPLELHDLRVLDWSDQQAARTCDAL